MSSSHNDDNNSEVIFNKLEEYMFTRGNMAKYNKVFSAMIVEKIREEKRVKQEEAQEEAQAQQTQAQHIQTQAQQTQAQHIQTQAQQAQTQTQAQAQQMQQTQFTPSQKDKLFWCFYIILKGFDEYELHQTDHFATEKAFKIATVEKMRGLKEELKEAKLKRNEIEDELVNKETITIKGLNALCLVHKVCITYIYDRMYCEFKYSTADSSNVCGVIFKNNKNNSVKYDTNDAYMASVHSNFWKVENIHKPLASASYYSVKDLQDICKKLEISITLETGKNKLKNVLYEDILKVTV